MTAVAEPMFGNTQIRRHSLILEKISMDAYCAIPSSNAHPDIDDDFNDQRSVWEERKLFQNDSKYEYAPDHMN